MNRLLSLPLILMTLLFTALSCSKPSTPESGSSHSGGSTNGPIYAYDANNTLLGQVQSYTHDYMEIKTSKGYWDYMTYTGYPYAKGNIINVPPNQQKWLFYIVYGTDSTSANYRKLGLVKQNEDTNTVRTVAFKSEDSGIGPKRYCEKEAVEYMEGDQVWVTSNDIYSGYYINSFDANQNSGTADRGVLNFKNGILIHGSTEDLNIHRLEECSNDDIGYPQLVGIDTQFRVRGPVSMKKQNGEVVPIPDATQGVMRVF